MGFIVNTNTAAMISTTQANLNSKGLTSSLEKLSSGLKINRAADDASGLAIADSLRSQANSLKQALSNANDAVGIIQIADKAMAQQVAIVDTIKTKATQAAQDGQSTASRKAIQSDIKLLMNQLDNIAGNTSYNGKQLLSGNFVNREFQIGAYSRNTVQASIEATSTDKLGHIRAETTKVGGITGSGITQLEFKGSHIPNGALKMESVVIDSKAGTGIGALAEVINKNSSTLGVRASYKVETLGNQAVKEGSSIKDLKINDVIVGTLSDIKANDSDGRLVATINEKKDETGVFAAIDERGHLKLTSADGRAIDIKSGDTAGLKSNFGIDEGFNGGRLTLVASGAIDIVVEDVYDNAGTKGALATAMNLDANGKSAMTEANFNFRGTLNGFSSLQADAMGVFANSSSLNYPTTTGVLATDSVLGAGVVTLEGAMTVMDIADSAIKQLDSIRSGLGSAQNELEAAINNISVTQTNVKASESGIRDVDFAEESANFSKMNILVQSGSYALTQANAVQQNILKLLQ